MTPNLWSANHPRAFWRCLRDLSDEAWQSAIAKALPLLDLDSPPPDMDSALAQTLGETRFGSDHWELGWPKRIYYLLKPLLPRQLTRWLRQKYNILANGNHRIPWPVEPRYAQFLWEVMRQLLILSGRESLPILNLWPGRKRYAFILTHDIETQTGQTFAKEVADLEEGLGFRSSFNFVPERYQVDYRLMNDLRERGFEIGVHGLKHDGKLFDSYRVFEARAGRINQYLQQWQAVGFRADLTHRQPEWMQLLDIEYDLSFFDTDPFEPIPGGTMSIWPFFIGNFVELPYTLVQDYTLTAILKETSPRVWLEKVDFIEKYHGMALLNSHPDYLTQKSVWNVYHEFLAGMKERAGYWHGLPRDAARWWQERAGDKLANSKDNRIEIGLAGNDLEWMD